MNFRTTYQANYLPTTIDLETSFLFFGSCFSTNIGEKIQLHGIEALVNPMGTLFHPNVIAYHLRRALQLYWFMPEEFECNEDGVYYHFMLHSSLRSVQLDDLVDECNQRLKQLHAFLISGQVLVMTFGTAFLYRFEASKDMVANCHKQPSALFTKEKSTVDNLVYSLSQVLSEIRSVNPLLQFIFTVSPVRHIKDGLIENSRSKASLLLMVEKLLEVFPKSTYFPAFEIMMDDLRDYRFYADDLMHPTDFAVEYIYNLFVQTYFPESMKVYVQKNQELQRALAHRSSFENTPSWQKHQAYIQKLEAEIQRIKDSKATN